MGQKLFKMQQKFLEILTKWVESKLIVDFHDDDADPDPYSGDVRFSVSVTVKDEIAPRLRVREEVHRTAEKLAAELSLQVDSAAVTAERSSASGGPVTLDVNIDLSKPKKKGR